MSNTTLSTLLSDIAGDRTLTDAQLKTVRRAFYDDGMMSPDEADMMFKVNDTAVEKPAEWNEFFVGALTDFLVRQTLPKGYVDTANAAWLMERIDHDGVLAMETEFELLMNVLHIAESVPPRLEAYALKQVEACVLEGRGYLADGRELSPGVIEERDVEILRKILYACGGDGGFGITQTEAELLFDLDEATREKSNHVKWRDLFVGAVANHLMTMGAPKVSGIEEARRRQEWLSSSDGIQWNLKDAIGALKELWLNPKPQSQFLDQAGRQEAERVDPNEAQWLIDRLNRDDVLSENEKALLEFLNRECPEVHASLRPLISAAA